MRSVVVFTFLLVVVNTSFATSFAFEAPNWKITPGVVCAPTDPDFKGYDYPEHVARCNRNVTVDMKIEIAKNYGEIPRAQWNNYEFDHLLPLCAGGSNSIGNIWPQPIEEAKKKDVIENEVCLGMRDGSMTQAQALSRIRDWFNMMLKEGGHAPKDFPPVDVDDPDDD